MTRHRRLHHRRIAPFTSALVVLSALSVIITGGWTALAAAGAPARPPAVSDPAAARVVMAPIPVDVAESVYQAANAAGQFPLATEGLVLQRVATAWQGPPINCDPVGSFEAPATYSYRCTLAAGHELSATIRRYDSPEEAKAAFDGERADDAIVPFHGHEATESVVDASPNPGLPLRSRIHRWHAERWLFTSVAFDDTGIPVAPPPADIAERLFEAALAQRLLNPEWPGTDWDIQHLAEMGGAVSAVTIDGHYAYVGIGGVLEVLDIGDPVNPRLVRTDTLAAVARDIVVHHDHVFVALGDRGLYVADVSDPTRPPQATLGSAGRVTGLFAAGLNLYVTTGTALQVLDITDPVQPARRSEIAIEGAAGDVFVASGYAYVTCLDFGVRVIDVHDPARPVEVGTVGNTTARGVDGIDHYVYIATGGISLLVVDVANPAAPQEVATLESSMGALTVAIRSGRAYVGGTEGFMDIVDVTTPAAPRIVGSHKGHGGSSRFAPVIDSAGGLALVCGWDTGLWLVDVSDPATPREIGSYGIAFDAADVRVVGDYAYVAAWAGGLRVIDVSDPLSPHQVGALAGTYVLRLDVADSHVYGMNNSQLAVIDVSDPTAPRLAGVGHMVIGAWPGNVAVADGFAYVAAGESGLHVFDVRDPAAPREVAVYSAPDALYWVDVIGGQAYVASHDGLRVLDVSEPRAPVEVRALSLPGSPGRVRVVGQHAYVVDMTSEMLQVVDVREPSAPRLVGALQASATYVDAAGYHLYLGGTQGVVMVDIEAPTDPRPLASYPFARTTQGLAVSGNHIYLAMWDRGFLTLWTGHESPGGPPSPIYLPAACRNGRFAGPPVGSAAPSAERRPIPGG